MRISRPGNRTPLIVGGCVGGTVLLVVLIAALSSSGSGKGPAAAAPSSKKEPVDVREMVQRGEELCSQGYGVLQTCEGELNSLSGLSVEQRKELKKKLENANELLGNGLSYFEKACDLSGEKYELKRYLEARKTIRGRLPELP